MPLAEEKNQYLGSGLNMEIKKLNARDYVGAANEFPRWTKAGGNELAGLVKRRTAERNLYLTDNPGNVT